MSYLGNTPVTQSFISGTDYFNGTGSQTVFTLTRSVASINDIQVTVNNVVQQPNSGYTVSNTTLTFDQAPSSGTNNVYVRYLSTTTQAITPSQNTVSWNTLDSNVQGDLGISYKNKIINGNMVIDQRNNGAAVTSNNNTIFSVDRFSYFTNGSAVGTLQQSSVAPSGFTNSLLYTITTGSASGSVTRAQLIQRIEGFNTADLAWGSANAKTVTLSFWVRSSLTGTFGGVLQNAAQDRSYAYTYTINAANTWEYKTITIPGEISGTWLTNTSSGIQVYWDMGCGSGLRTAAGVWTVGDFRGATGTGSVVATTGATWQMTGVQLEVGTQATTFTTAGGSYGAELALCQRYYFKFLSVSSSSYFTTGWTESTTAANGVVNFPVQLRTNPTALEQSGTATDYRVVDLGSGIACNAVPSFVASQSANAALVRFSVASGLTAGRCVGLSANSSTAAFLAWSAEL